MKDIKEQISELRNEFNRRIDELEKELKPEFKVGQWVIGKINSSDGSQYYPTKPERIKRMCINEYVPDEYYGREDFQKTAWNKFYFVRHATPQEIESHLRSICDKYVGKKVRSLFCSNYIATISEYWKYDFERDKLWYYGDDYNVIVYEAGKFAEILPSLKPKPETREEFAKFMDDWSEELGWNFDKFLDQYNIK